MSHLIIYQKSVNWKIWTWTRSFLLVYIILHYLLDHIDWIVRTFTLRVLLTRSFLLLFHFLIFFAKWGRRLTLKNISCTIINGSLARILIWTWWRYSDLMTIPIHELYSSSLGTVSLIKVNWPLGIKIVIVWFIVNSYEFLLLAVIFNRLKTIWCSSSPIDRLNISIMWT